MNRRRFLKICGLLPIGGSLSLAESVGASEGKPQSNPSSSISYGVSCSSDPDESEDKYVFESPFVLYKGIWFFSDQNVIRYCSEKTLSDLREVRYIPATVVNNNWIPITIVGGDFDYWWLYKDRLYWCGKKEVWEILVEPIKIRYWSEKNNNWKAFTNPVRLHLCTFKEKEQWDYEKVS